MKMYTRITILIILGLFVASMLFACGAADEDPNEPENTNENAPEDTQGDGTNNGNANGDTALADRGEELVQNNCISCHGGNLEGGSGPGLIGIRDEYSEDELREILVNGRGMMPGGLVEGEEDAVIAYLLTLE